jgi:hypothetical protein
LIFAARSTLFGSAIAIRYFPEFIDVDPDVC